MVSSEEYEPSHSVVSRRQRRDDAFTSSSIHGAQRIASCHGVARNGTIPVVSMVTRTAI